MKERGKMNIYRKILCILMADTENWQQKSTLISALCDAEFSLFQCCTAKHGVRILQVQAQNQATTASR